MTDPLEGVPASVVPTFPPGAIRVRRGGIDYSQVQREGEPDMSTEQEKKRARLHELLVDGAPAVAADGYDLEDLAERLLPNVDVTLPPEPEWKPGQRVMLRIPHVSDEKRLAERTKGGHWRFVGSEGVDYRTDDEVTDVEPVAVLNAEDVRELMSYQGGMAPAASTRDFFRERGLGR